MGRKPQAPTKPSFQPSIIYEDGTPVGETRMNDGKVEQHYYMSPEQRELKQKRQERIAALEQEMESFKPNLNSLSPEFKQQIDQTQDAYINEQQDKFYEEFNPMVARTRANYNTRYGSTNNSMFDRANRRLERLEADTLQDINRRAALDAQQLRQQELGNYQNYYNSIMSERDKLMQGLDQYMNQAQLGYQGASQGTNMGNAFNTDIYRTNMSRYAADLDAQRSRLGSLFGGLSGGLRFFG